MEHPPLPNQLEHRTIAYAFSFDEYVEMNVLFAKPAFRRRTIYFLCLGALLMLAGGTMQPLMEMPASNLIVSLGISCVLVPLFNRYNIRRACVGVFKRLGNNVRIKRTVTASEKGLHSEGQDSSFSFVPWRSVTRIIEAEGATSFMMPVNNALIVSQRAFGSESDYKAFVEFAKEQHRAQIAKPAGE